MMEEVFLDLLKGLGVFGTTIIIFLYFSSKLPTIISSYDSFVNKKLKDLSELSQGNYLDGDSGMLISNVLAEHYLTKAVKYPVTGYEIKKINELYQLLDKSISLKDIFSALAFLDLSKINTPEQITNAENEMEALKNKFEKAVNKFSFFGIGSTGLLSVLTSYPNFIYYDILIDPNVFYPIFIALGVVTGYFQLGIRKARNKLHSATNATIIQKTLVLIKTENAVE